MEVWLQCEDTFIRKDEISRFDASVLLSPQTGSYIPTVKVILKNGESVLGVFEDLSFRSRDDATEFITQFITHLINIINSLLTTNCVVDIHDVAKKFYSLRSSKGRNVEVSVSDSVKLKGDEEVTIRVVEETREELRKG